MIRLLNTHTYFNPRSHEGSDGSLDLYYNYLLISIHAPTRGATFTRIVHYFHYLFQSTLPRGERPHTTHSVDGIWDFNPRSHEGSDVQKLVDKLSDITDFNPRSHEGSDYDKRERLNTDEVFQSTLPRGERRCINDLCIRDTQFQSTLPRGERPNRTVN